MRQCLVVAQAIIVPDGVLALVPFSALIDENGHYVGESLQVRLIPSLSTAKMIQERPEKPGDKGIPLIVGDPEVGRIMRDDGSVVLVDRLSSAEKEAEVISEMLPVELLTGSEATKEKFLDKVGSASLIHIAAHGDKKRGEILLARRPGTEEEIPKARDLMLLTSDLERRRIKAKLVVLSCCHSGCGDVKAAEGVIGIARAFLGAGARAVLVTLWAIDDGATLWFMAHFYDHLRRGGSAMEAINKGMKAVRELGGRFQHPRYWAPFVLLGEDVIPFPDAVK